MTSRLPLPDRIYLDHASGSPLRPEALDAMTAHLRAHGGNPSSLHREGKEALAALENARRTVADILAASPTEVTFTSGGTESVNTAIKGVALAEWQAGTGNHIITTEAEHQATLNSCRYLERFGFEVTYLPVDRFGLITPADVAAAITPRTVLVSVMYANNEVGGILPIAEIARAVRERERALDRRIAVHTDAVQAPGMVSVDMAALGVDLLSLSAHKFGGPEGVGVLTIRRATPFLPLMDGGVQERRRRAGTENVAGAIGMATALALAEGERPHTAPRLRRLRNRLIDGIASSLPSAQLNGPRTERLANNVNFSFPGVDGESLLMALDRQGIAASAGSACAHITWEPSHVLLAMGRTLEEAGGALRLSLGRETTDGEIDAALAIVPRVVRELAPARV